ncbi:Exosome complex component Rrp4 [Candidatus Norongarragalina meridionalis]|nr:Exosome complex component Rrp4 [Candidatus Norongarragalina meridionalis]
MENERTIVVPGEKVFDDQRRVEGGYADATGTFATTMAMVHDGKLVPLKGYYLPKPGDAVVGIVKEEMFSGYEIEINSPYEGRLSTRETRERFAVGEVISAKVVDVNEIHEAIIAEPRKLWGGEIIDVESVKVPRIIGRNASMVETIKQHTKSELLVGKNGRIYVKGGNTALAIRAILKICKEAHTGGLTDRVVALLEGRE